MLTGVGGKPRTEASLLPWEKLTDDQQRAVLNSHLRFHQFAHRRSAGSAPKSPFDHFLPHIDANPMNRVVLIDGGRGSGKTVVLLRLLRYWSDGVREKYEAQQSGTEESGTQTSAPVREPEFLGAIRDHTDGPPELIVPIANIGLQTLSESASLLPYIGAAFHQVLRGIEAPHEQNVPRAAPPWVAVEDSAMKCVSGWRDFMAAAAQWDGNLKEREKALDAEAYMLELRDAELQRLQLSDVFRKFVDGLVIDFKARFGSSKVPLFVIAIDDADMQPKHSVRVLNTIRLLEHERVAYLLVGDLPLFQSMLSDWYMGRIRQPLTLLDLDADRSAELIDREAATRLANDVLDKVIPRGHRFGLPPLPLHERHKLMKETFERVEVNAEPLIGNLKPDPRNFYDYLEADPWTRNALPDRVRRVIAFREYVDQQGQAVSKGERVATLLLRMWRDVIDGSGLLRDVADDLQRVLRVDDFDRARLLLETLRLRTSPYFRRITPYREISDSFWFALRDVTGYSIRFDRTREKLPLNEEIASVLILATDLIADDPNGDFIGPSLTPSGYDLAFGTVSYDSDLAGQAIDFYWPLPNWDSFLDFHVFSRLWGDVVRGASSKLETVAPHALVPWLARWFVHLVVHVSEVRKIDSTSGEPPAWSTLASAVEALGRKNLRFRRDRNVIDWARTRAVLMAAPESGLPRAEADEWFHALVSDTKLSNARKRALRRVRFERARAAILRSVSGDNLRSRNEINDLLKEIDEASAERFAWSHEIGVPLKPARPRKAKSTAPEPA